jgi:hypothetical protein
VVVTVTYLLTSREGVTDKNGTLTLPYTLKVVENILESVKPSVWLL